MRILLLAILCVVYLPVYAEPLDPCATNGNLLWEGARTYEDSANRDQRIRSVIEQNAMGLDNVLTVAVWFGYRSEEHTSELQSLMRISYAVFCLKKKKTQKRQPK